MKIYKLYLFVIVLFTQSCSDDKSDWIYLFDGKTTEGWRAYNGDKIPEKWAVVDGELTFDTQLKLEEDWKGGGDFIYFELAEYNEEAKNKIDTCKSYKELKKLFTELTTH